MNEINVGSTMLNFDEFGSFALCCPGDKVPKAVPEGRRVFLRAVGAIGPAREPANEPVAVAEAADCGPVKPKK